jgi:cobalt-zinc-cadmium efflux system outer membrane protein
MNYGSTENWKSMRHSIKYILFLTLLAPLQLLAQQPAVLPLDTILQRIDRNNVLLQSYGLKAESYKYSAEAATAWMAPMVGVGTFMTPYPNQIIMDGRDRGNLMLAIEQDIPNTAKLNAKKKYIASRANVERANRDITLNDFKAQAKRLYFNWLIAEQRIKVLQENERIMVMMKKIEEVRYPYNQSQLGSVFKADARIEENRNMIRMQEGTIAKARAWLNSLMNMPGNESFEIDSLYQPTFTALASYDTAMLASVRKDVFKMNESIRSMQLNIESMQKEKKPDFRIRFDHMYPLDAAMPTAFSVMGMISIPIAPWTSKMYKSEIKAMQYNIQGMEKERAAMLQETQGMLYGMQYEIQSMQKRITAMEEKIIPALKKTFDANFLVYQENKIQLPAVIDAWEAQTMMQMNVLDEKLKLYEMIVDYEKELYR